MRGKPFLAAMLLGLLPAHADKKYDSGAGDTEIKVGTIVPLTGVFSEYGAIARAEDAYFRMLNDRGGINGRRITFIKLDSASDPTRSLLLARQLVEKDQVLLTCGIWGTPANLAVRPYLNGKRVPQLFVAATDTAFNDPAHYPWTMGFQPDRETEGVVYARYLLQNKPGAKIAILCGNVPADQQWIDGIRLGLGAQADKMIVKVARFNYATPGAPAGGIIPPDAVPKSSRFDYAHPDSIEAQVALLKDSGADTFMNLAVGKFATRAIRTAYDLGWHPLEFIPNASLSVASFLDPAGLQKCVGLICNARSKSWKRSQASDPAVNDFLNWMAAYNPDASLRDANYVYGYEVAQTLAAVLRQCGDDLTRANVLKQATSLDLQLGMLRPGIKITTGPNDYRPIKQLFLIRFDGAEWQPIGPIGG